MNVVLCEEYNLFVSLLLSNPFPTPNNTPAFFFKFWLLSNRATYNNAVPSMQMHSGDIPRAGSGEQSGT